MNHAHTPHPDPAAGTGTAGWYVDERCTNCDVARQLAPDLIGEADGRSH
ncbi:MBL fold metallo-hydrolase, partial [Streptomyces lydicus]